MSEQRETPAPTTESVGIAQTNGVASPPAPAPATAPAAPVKAPVPSPAPAPAPPAKAPVQSPAPAPAPPVKAPVPSPTPVPATAPAPAPAPVPAPAPAPVPTSAPAPAPTPVTETVPAPAAATVTAVSPKLNADSGTPSQESIPARAKPAMNGQQATINGHAAIQRGLELLAETEASQTNEEIKKLDTQLDYFNKYLDKYEKRNAEMTERLSNLLEHQKEERVKRRASFMQKEEQMKAEQDNFDSQVRQMFAKCAQMRRQSAPVTDNGVGELLEESRKTREGHHEAPIQEANGHDEAAEAATN